MPRYWVYLDRQVTGPHDPVGVARLDGVGLSTLVCPDGGGGRDMRDWQYLGAYPELFGFMGKPAVPAPAPSEPPVSMAAQAAQWMGDVLRKIKRSLELEQGCAVYALQRIDRWAVRARDLGLLLGVYGKRLEAVEDQCRRVADRADAAEARRREVMRQAAVAAEARLALAEASASTGRRRELLEQLIALQKERNAAEAAAAKARKRKGLFGGLGRLKPLSFKGPAKAKLNIKPLS